MDGATEKTNQASNQQQKELTEAEKIQAMMKQDNPEYDPTNLPPIPKKWTSRPRAVYNRVHYPNRTWRKAEATPSTSECPQEQPKELLCNLAKKLVDNDPPVDMTEISPAYLPKSHHQMAQISTKLRRPERPMESLPPRVEGSLPEEVGSERSPSSGPNKSPKNPENFGCDNIRRDGGPPPPPQQQQQHWGQQPHMWTPPNVSPPFCATQLTVGPPLGYDDPFYGVPPPEYMPTYQNSYSWPQQPEMSDHHPYPGYYYEDQPSPVDYVHAGREPAGSMYAHYSPPYRMDERLAEREDKFARSEIKDPVQEFERFLAEKDSRKMALQTTVRKRPRSRSISPMSRRTSRNSSERSQSRRRRSFSRSPSPKRRRSYSRRRDGKSRSPSRNVTSNRKERRIFGEHVENDKRKDKRTCSPSSSKSSSSSDTHRKEDRKENRKGKCSRSRSKR